MKNNISKVLLAALILETALIIWLVVERNKQIETNIKLTTNLQEATNEKAEVENELQNMLVQYEELKTSNDAINKQLEDEQEKIKELLKELKNVKRSDKIKIKQLERETETLRSIMRSYIKQIDSLNTKNKLLTARNLKMQKKYSEEVAEKEEVIYQRDSLNQKVEMAAVLKSYNINITPLNKRGKNTKRARKMKKIKVCFTLQENVVAMKGKKDVFIRVSGPDNAILTNKDSKTFLFEEKEIVYSSKRKITYDGEAKDVCIYWSAEDEQVKGKYNVTIYADGNNIGEKLFELK